MFRDIRDNLLLKQKVRERFKFCVNSKSDIRFVNSYEGADRFCPYLYYTGDFSPVNAAS